MEPQQNLYQEPKVHKKINPILIIFGGFLLVTIVIVTISLLIVFHSNPYGKQIKINNFNTYYKNTPSDTKDAIYNTLYNMVVENSPEGNKLPHSGARIREGSNTATYNESQNIHFDTFMIDIKELQQSYFAQVYWSDDPNNQYLGGYPILLTCPTKDQAIYDNFSCVDMFTNDGDTTDPVFSKLPIYVSYFNDNYSSYTSYNITSKNDTSNEKIEIVITDETGGNYNAAIQKLHELNIDLDDYIIKYIDTSDQGFGYAGEG